MVGHSEIRPRFAILAAKLIDVVELITLAALLEDRNTTR